MILCTLLIALAFLIRARHRGSPREWANRQPWADERERDAFERKHDAEVWRNIGGRI